MFSKSMDEKRQDHGKDMHESAAEIQNEENGAQPVSASDHESNASTGGFLLNRLMTGLLNRTMGWRAASSDVSDSISENVNNETMYFDSLSNSDPNIDAIRLDEPQETNDNLDGREKLNHNLSKHNSEGEREMGPNLEEVPESEPEMLIMAGGEMVSTDAYSDTESSPLPSDYVEQFQRYGGMKEFALLVASTLASVPEGCEAKRMRALIANDWSIDAEMVANRFDFETFAQFLESEFMRAYVEEKAIVNDSVLYTVKVAPEIEHITQTVADEKLSKEQLALKRKYQRLLELRKPENQEAFIEGKRRILKILFDLNAFDEAVAYSRVQNEYMKKYEVCLNAEELSRLFRNKSALKNIRHAFYKEIDVIEQNPLIIKLKANVKLPDELSEEDKRQAVGIKDVEIPSFIDDSFQPATQQRVGFAAAQNSDIKKQTNMRRQASPNQEATMNWDGEGSADASSDDGQDAVNNAGPTPANEGGFACVPNTKATTTRGAGSTKWGGDTAKYTGDEESEDSSDSYFKGEGGRSKKGKVSHRSRQRTVAESKQIPSALEERTLLNSGRCRAVTNEDLSRSQSTSPSGIRGSRSGERCGSPRSQSTRRKSTAERSLQKSIEQSKLRRTIQQSEAMWRQQPGASSPIPESKERRDLAGVPRGFADELVRREGGTHQGAGMPRPLNEPPYLHRDQNRSSHPLNLSSPSDERYGRQQSRSAHANSPLEPGIAHHYAEADRNFRASASASRSPSRLYGQNYFRRCGDDYPVLGNDNQQFLRDTAGSARQYDAFSMSSFGSNDRLKNAATQTDDGWLEVALEELEVIGSSSNHSHLGSSASSLTNVTGPDADVAILATVVELIVELHAPRPVLISDLPKLVGNVYGEAIDPVEDRKYRISWHRLIDNYCHGRVKICQIPGHEVLVYNSPNSQR